jgi:hypothetical protein
LILDIGGTEFQAQLQSWTLNDNTDDPETFFVYEPGEEFVEQPDPAYSLGLHVLLGLAIRRYQRLSVVAPRGNGDVPDHAPPGHPR